MADSAYAHLFGKYLIEISNFYKRTLSSFREQDGKIETLKVYYGAPSAVFRKFQQTRNGKMDLPFLNFHAMDFQRDFSQENPFVRVKGKHFSGGTSGDFVSVERAPQVWNITMQFNFFTAGYIERDHIMSEFFTLFEGGDLYIKYLHDPAEPNHYRWINLKQEENFQDETELEGTGEKETRDIVRTTLQVKMPNAILFYPSWALRPIKTIQTNHVLYDPETGLPIDADKHKITVLSAPGEPLMFETVTDYF